MEVKLERAQARFAAKQSGDVGEARRAAVSLAETLGMDETAQGRVALVVTESGTNLIKHAGGGEIIVGAIDTPTGSGVEILAVDRGPGIPDARRAMQDGISSSGSSGNGLGGIRRLSDEFDLYSDPTGTVLVGRVFPPAAKQRRKRGWRIGGVCLPLLGEVFCGDAWDYRVNGDHLVVLMVDGLGHGRPAYDAAQDAVRIVGLNEGKSGPELLQLAHASARGTRGAAAAVTEIHGGRGIVTHTGIGNISASVINRSGASRSMISSHGVLGLEQRPLRPYDYPWDPESLLLLHSDGLASHWNLTKYPGLLMRDPSLIAAVLYRDHARPRDDVTVIVARAEDA